MMKICICGGGNLGHVVAGFIAAQGQHEVRLLTRKPENWNHTLTIETPDKQHSILIGHLHCISDQPEEAIQGADIVLLCLPGFSIREVLLQIKDYLKPTTAVGSVVSSTGFFFQAKETLPNTNVLFGFQRVPFISRILIYGHSARLMGYKEHLHMAVENSEHPELLCDTFAQLLQTPVRLLDNFYEATLSNSNPLLHPARLYSLWKDWHYGIIYPKVPLFYEEWTAEAAQLYINMDNELQELLLRLPIRKGSIPDVLHYYESTNASSLAWKLQSIQAFKGIKSPMKKIEGGYIPDLQSRYFTEDFPYGLAIVHRLTHEKGTPSPTIDAIYQWGMRMLDGQ